MKDIEFSNIKELTNGNFKFYFEFEPHPEKARLHIEMIGFTTL